MRVWFLTHRLPFAPNRGDRIRAFHMLRFLQRRAEVHLLSLVHDREEAGAAAQMQESAASVVTAHVPAWRNRARAAVRLPTGAPLTHLLLDAPELAPKLERLRATHPPDVVLAYCSGMAPYAMSPALAGVPFVLDMVDVDSQKWQQLGRTGRWPHRLIYRREGVLLERFERRAIDAAFATLAVNRKEAAALHRLDPRARVMTVENGIALETFAPTGPPSTERAVVFCGVLDYAPNEEAAVRLARDIWPRVRARCADARLYLVGANPTARVRSASAADASIEVTGTVPDVRPYLWKSAVSAAPIHVARGLQNKVLEALAAGLPAVVSPAVAEGLPPGVMPAVTTADTDEAMAAAICELMMQTPDERRARAGSADLGALSWDRQLQPLFTVLQQASESAVSRRDAC